MSVLMRIVIFDGLDTVKQSDDERGDGVVVCVEESSFKLVK